MADEMEAKATEAIDQPPPSAPPKKKRTRTLTTPHQSAVLHALLSQSRFPTAAMREEVGQSVGLSARKVQVWFQNQRQKERRPRNQGDSSRPPQYGPFQSVGGPSSVHRFQNYGPSRPHYPGCSPPEAPSGSLEPPLRLGPGAPGAPAYPFQGYRPVLPPSPNPSVGPSFPQVYSFQSTNSPQSYRAVPPASRFSPSPRGNNWRERERDPSRTLPPLLPTRPSSSNPLPSFWEHMDPQSTPMRSFSLEQSAAPHRPESGRRAPSNLPPPFTLQPAPQWDGKTCLPRPNSWSRQSSQSMRPRSMSPLASCRYPNTRRVAEGGLSPVPSESSHPRARHPPPCSGRYDPIRSAFVPFSPNPATPPMIPHRPHGGGQADRDDRPLSRSH